MPESLDTALFRRFDEIVSYPLPNEAQIQEVISKNMSSYSFNRRINYKEISKIASGMNYSELTKACREVIKNMVLKGKENLDLDFFKTILKKRKEANG
jgi:SpoVK/Ycf46/Vps4 family AAA+-type ATPase